MNTRGIYWIIFIGIETILIRVNHLQCSPAFDPSKIRERMQSLLLLKCSNVIYFNGRLASTSVKPSIISRIRYVLNHYWLGSKLLYRNSRSVREIRKKDITILTRIDHLTLDQFRYDIRVGLPFVTLFALPIVGYTAPLLALLAPKYLPSTLIMPQQKTKFLLDDANASTNLIPSLNQFSQQHFDSNSISGMIPTMQLINQVLNSNDRYEKIMSSIPEYSQSFKKCFSLDQLPREHLLLLHQSVIHSSFVARYLLLNYSLESQLEMWEYRTLIDDQHIGNIDQLSPYMLVMSLHRRGLYLHVNEMGKVLEFEQTRLLNQMEKKSSKSNEQLSIDEQILGEWRLLLKQWINIHQKLSKFNPISTSFLLHISPLLTLK